MKIIEPKYNWAYTPGYRNTTTHLILHHAAADNISAETIHSWHLANGWAGIAYHYYVRKDGSVYRGRPEAWTGGHTTNWNWCSLGICFEGNFDAQTMPEEQRKAGAELVADIVKRYPGIIVGKHKDYQATACPGANFPFDAIVQGEVTEPEDSDAENYGASPWAVESCEKAIEKGIFKGDGKGNYNWQEPLTREAFCVVMDRLGLL